MSSTDEATRGELPLVHGRYRILEWLGAGGTGTVHRALDTITHANVAVKLLSPLTTAAALRQRREVLALRALQVPGVVRLLDEGTSEGRPFLVMEFVDGAPFPGGARRTWEDIAPTVSALLEALARVHAAGVIHRDLKPGNVLVDAAGRPMILDFGLARGDTLGDAITRPDAVVGTPRYQAPEQLSGQALDPRTDLYAVGVMLYEVLAGRPPHPLDDLSSLIAARVWRDAPPLQFAAPTVPGGVCRVVDRLLARIPEGRPRSANEVLEELRSVSSPDRAPLPWLGSDALVRVALDAAHAQRGVDLSGPPGSGKTRTLHAVAAGLARTGRRSVWTAPGSRPFESVAPLVGSVKTLALSAPDAPPAPPDPATVAQTLRARLRETLAGGTVLLVDDADELDPWSAELLEDVRDSGPILRAWREPRADATPIAPLPEAALHALFHGPDRLLHLREDAARALHARTGGNPGRILSELAAWVGAGFATWRDGRVALDRSALDRLQADTAVRVAALPAVLAAGPLKRGLEHMLAWVTLAWPHTARADLHAVCGGSAWEVDLVLAELDRVGAVRATADGRFEPRLAALHLQAWSAEERRAAHAAIAAHLAPGAAGRYAHLVAAADFGGAAREAEHVAARLAEDGYVGHAVGVISQGLDAAREAGDAALEESLLAQATRVALSENVPGTLRYVRYEIARATPTPLLPALDRLLAGGVALGDGDLDAVLGVIAELTPFADPTLDCWRRALRLAATLPRDPAAAAPLVEEALAWAEGNSFCLGRAWGWQGLLRYRQGRHAEAAACHLRALPLKVGAADRLSTLINAASAFLEAQDLGEALRWATEAEALAAERRLAIFEARAAWIRRCVEYRSGAARAPDLEFLDAAEALGARRFAAVLHFTEATVAWRSGHPSAARLSDTAATRLALDGNRPIALTSRAVALLAAGERAEAPWRALAEEALALGPIIPTAQALGLVASAGVVWEPAWTDAVTAALGAGTGDPRVPRVVLADDEISAYVQKAAHRSV